MPLCDPSPVSCRPTNMVKLVRSPLTVHSMSSTENESRPTPASDTDVQVAPSSALTHKPDPVPAHSMFPPERGSTTIRTADIGLLGSNDQLTPPSAERRIPGPDPA